MRWPRPLLFIRLAIVALLVVNVVPEALAALPLCSSDFGSVRLAGVSAATKVNHSHGSAVAHECLATMPGKQAATQQAQHATGDGVAVLPVLAHPASMLAASGPSPRGSPARGSAYLAQRSSVLLLI